MMKISHSELYYVRVLLRKMKIKEIMSQDVVCINAEDPFSKVVKMMNEKRIRHIPVVKDLNVVIGLMSQRDLYKIQSPRRLEDGSWYYDLEDLDHIILRNVMRKNPFTLGPESSVAEAVISMVDHKYGCIPIVQKNGVLCGIVTQHDILKLAASVLGET